MAKPGDPHEVMANFLGNRIQTLYPDCKISYGKVLKPIGLKPDIAVTMSDGRKWVFEMVHGNRNPTKIKQNHLRYQQAGIFDTWILWDDLRPKVGHPIPPTQGILSESLKTTTAYKLTKPQKALLDLWPGNPKYIYTFSVDSPGLSTQLPDSNFLNVLMMGITVYQFDGSVIGNRYIATSDFLPLLSLKFSEEGKISSPPEDSFLENIMLELGFELNNFIPLNNVIHLLSLISSQEGLNKIYHAYLKELSTSLPQSDLHEFNTFIRSDEVQKIQPFTGRINQSEVHLAYEDPQKISLLLEDSKDLQTYLEGLPLPKAIKDILANGINEEILTAYADSLKLQSINPHYLALKKQ